jgi:anti-anti-sigma factor
MPLSMTHPTAVVAPAHPLVFGTSTDAFRREVQACFDAGHEHIAANLAAVPYMDSEGVRALVHAHNLARERHGSFTIVAPSPRVRQLLETTHLDTVFQIHHSLDILDPAK